MLGYSAVIIARNEERHIKETVESILKQSIKPYRIIVVDDGSTDSTPEILGTMPVTVKRLPDHDRGSTVYCNTLSDVRNAGLAYIRDDPVDWVYSGDADIVLPPRYCESIMRHAGERDSYIAAGIIGDKLDYLPYGGMHDDQTQLAQECRHGNQVGEHLPLRKSVGSGQEYPRLPHWRLHCGVPEAHRPKLDA